MAVHSAVGMRLSLVGAQLPLSGMCGVVSFNGNVDVTLSSAVNLYRLLHNTETNFQSITQIMRPTSRIPWGESYEPSPKVSYIQLFKQVTESLPVLSYLQKLTKDLSNFTVEVSEYEVLDPYAPSKLPFHQSLTLCQWDDRLLTLDPLSINHVLKQSTIYEKPWQSRRLITSLIGCGMLAAEGDVHKRQRRVATSAFGVANMKALVPTVWGKGNELKERWLGLIRDSDRGSADGMRLDVCSWISRATFDVIGLAGFDYQFNSIQDETNELFCAYKDMFEIAVSQGSAFRSVLGIYFPVLNKVFVSPLFPKSFACAELNDLLAGQNDSHCEALSRRH